MKSIHTLAAIFSIFVVVGIVRADEAELIKRLEALEAKNAVLEKEVRELKANQTWPKDRLKGALPATSESLGELTQRIEELESHREELSGTLPKWATGLKLSGNADFSFLSGQDNSHIPNNGYLVDNARLFFDFDVAEDTSFYFEWDIVREAAKKMSVGQMYLRLDRLFGNESLNLKTGRMPIPFGEEYLRFHEQRSENPLISFSAPAPYNWDEGIMLFGAVANERVDYVLSIMDGDNAFNGNSNEGAQLAAKLTLKPSDWVRLVFSVLDTGKLGSSSSPADSALEFGGTHARPFGSGTTVDSYQDGVIMADDPNTALEMTAWEIDVILTPGEWGRLWLAYGQVGIRSDGDSSYDRDLKYWVIEGVLELGALEKSLEKYYVAARYSTIGTFDSDEGYSLEAMNAGSELGFNTRDVVLFSLGVGARIRENLTLKLEYSWYDFSLVDGVPDSLRDQTDDRDVLSLGLTIKF